MTKYILHGGGTSNEHPDNDSYFREMTKGFGDNTVNILLNYFSREDDLDNLVKQDKPKFEKNSVAKKLNFEVADPDNLASQIKKCDVMYMRGGVTGKLKSLISKTPNLEKLFEGKVISGSSAGVYVLTKHYYGNDSHKFGEGLGILNIKAFCHYKPKDSDVVEELLKIGEELSTIILPDYKWEVLLR
jgi:cyanophycinase-like exopeptidase